MKRKIGMGTLGAVAGAVGGNIVLQMLPEALRGTLEGYLLTSAGAAVVAIVVVLVAVFLVPSR